MFLVNQMKNNVTMQKLLEHFQSNQLASWLVYNSVTQRLLWSWFHHLKKKKKLLILKHIPP